MKLVHLIAILVTVAVVSAGVTYLVYVDANELPAGTKRMPYVFSVSEYSGVDAGTDIFRLGAITQGGGAYRTIDLGNAAVTAEPMVVTVRAVGPGSQWLLVEPPTLVLPGTVTVRAVIPDEAPLGSYRGELLVIPGNHSQ